MAVRLTHGLIQRRHCEGERAHGGPSRAMYSVFVMFLADPSIHENVKLAIPQVKIWVPFRIDRQGSQLIFHDDSVSHH